MMQAAITNELNSIGQIIGAVAALGTASYGLVDVTKFFAGGISNVGFGYVRAAVKPFSPALVESAGTNWQDILRANWLNGMAKDDQKSVAKSLIRLGLSTNNAAQLAKSGRVDGNALQTVVTKLDAGTALTDTDLNVIGRFDAMIDAALDGGFERGDQFYRDASKALAALFAVILAITGEIILISGSDPAFKLTLSFIGTKEFWFAVLVGAVSVPLAPIAKDLSSSLVAAVKAMQATGG